MTDAWKGIICPKCDALDVREVRYRFGSRLVVLHVTGKTCFCTVKEWYEVNLGLFKEVY